MARPPRFDESVLLDAAVRLVTAAGPAAVTMAAVARESGAPNGSVYHRFPQRAALLAALWLRTVERFQDGYLATLNSAPEPLPAARAAARHVVAWSRANPQEAALLLHGPDEFGRAEWPEEYVRRAKRGNRGVLEAVTRVAESLGATTPAETERISLAVIDLPLGIVRRHLGSDHGLPEYAEDLAECCAADLIGDRAK
ncbi:TetR/AcrR family transcriptional regulator [Streptomyces sp. NPDC048496]|uniref:TetR/AcrR family transcriptional regulator n=1 Tax=Streptomyces sp. NPDC048496 TaxID=3365558 RepID=UPI0037214BAE